MPRPVQAGVADSSGVWAGVREAASSSRYLGAMLSELELESFADGKATLIGPASIVSAAQTKLTDLEQLFARVTGRPIRVALRAHEPAAAAAREAPRAPAADHPLVRQAIEQLGARIVAVHPRSRPSGAAP
ncbi:MAG: hypothetical protein AABZ53_13870 [Planctomycetota bacterium]